MVQEALEIYEFRVGVEESSGLWLGAKRTTYDLILGIVRLEIDTADEHRGIRGRSSNDDLLRAALQVGRGPSQDMVSELVVQGRVCRYTHFAVVVKTPVDSTMYSAPTEAQLMLAGSFSWKTEMGLPSTQSLPSLASTVPLKRP